MSCSVKNGGREGREHDDQPVLRRSLEVEPKLVTVNGSVTAHQQQQQQQLRIDENLLVDPKLLFIGSKIGEGAHGKVYEGRSVSIRC